MRIERDALLISDDKTLLDIILIHAVLRETYWARGIPLETVQRAIVNSMCFGIYEEARQLGFCRVVSDCATFAYLADVFIIPERRGQGLSKWLISCVMRHPDLQGLRRWLLATADAHGLYAQYGFKPLAKPERIMEINEPDVYRTSTRGVQA